MSYEELETLKELLEALELFYYSHGNHVRAHDVLRMLDGIKEYENDILNQ
jgi:hypothetical protein